MCDVLQHRGREGAHFIVTDVEACGKAASKQPLNELALKFRIDEVPRWFVHAIIIALHPVLLFCAASRPVVATEHIKCR